MASSNEVVQEIHSPGNLQEEFPLEITALYIAESINILRDTVGAEPKADYVPLPALSPSSRETVLILTDADITRTAIRRRGRTIIYHSGQFDNKDVELVTRLKREGSQDRVIAMGVRRNVAREFPTSDFYAASLSPHPSDAMVRDALSRIEVLTNNEKAA